MSNHIISPQTMAGIVKMISSKEISRTAAKDLMELYFCVGMVRQGHASGIKLPDGTIWTSPDAET